MSLPELSKCLEDAKQKALSRGLTSNITDGTMTSKLVFCVVFVFLVVEGNAIKGLFRAGKNVVKGSIQVGASTVTKGLALGNFAVQKGTSLVTSGVEKGTLAGKIVVGAGVAVAGHALAVGSDMVVNTTGRVDSIIHGVPVLGFAIKAGNDRMRQTVSSVNKVGQAILNGVDTVSDASFALANKATQIKAGVVSTTAKLGAAVGQATVALGASVMQTGVDNVYTLGKNVVHQMATGHFNVSALGDNMTVGSNWIVNDNAKQALTNLLPVLNSTFSSSSKAYK